MKELLFVREQSPLLRFTACVVVSIVLLFVEQRQPLGDKLRYGMAVVVYPIQWAVHAPNVLFSNLAQYFRRKTILIKKLQDLDRRNLLLNVRVQKFQAIESENVRLRKLLKLSPQRGENFLAAEIMCIDSDSFVHQVKLNRGKIDGVYTGQMVMDHNGIVGSVINVNHKTSTVLLLTDPSFAIPVENVRNGRRAIASGTGVNGMMLLRHVPNTADIKVGDLLITSGLGGRYSTGYPVGVVFDVQREPSKPFAEIIVKSNAELGASRHVLLLGRMEIQE